MRKTILIFATSILLLSCGKEKEDKTIQKTTDKESIETVKPEIKSDSTEKIAKNDSINPTNTVENITVNFSSESLQGYWNTTSEDDDGRTVNIEGNNLSSFGGPCQSSYTIKLINDTRFEMVYNGTDCRINFEDTYENIDKTIGYGYLKSPDELVFEIKKECFLMDKGQHLLTRANY
ncbi:hypothetical protein [Flavobacterium sp. GCM10027622]|uniref:hypothetical protein n=1 Tax=unclassified Flavobacterium TaxID=196869 RepID=UPI003605D5B0